MKLTPAAPTTAQSSFDRRFASNFAITLSPAFFLAIHSALL